MTADQKPGELLPCLGCGYGYPKLGQWFPHPTEGWWRQCPGCKRCTGQKLTQAEADADWNEMNRRAERTAGEAAARWRPLGLWHITADDRPTESGWLLVYFDGCIAPEAMEFDKDRGFCDPDGHFYKRHREPLAWMHMPPPPTTAARREG